MNRFRRHRTEGRYSDAIDDLIKVCGTEKNVAWIRAQPAVLRECLLSERCLVLDWAIHQIAHGRRDQCGERLEKLRTVVAPLLGMSAQLFVARLDLIQTVMLDAGDTNTDAKGTTNNSAVENLKNAIVKLVAEVQEGWEYCRHTAVQNAEATHFVATPDEPLNGPSFLGHLSSDRHRELFHQLAQDYGWMHPGLLLAGETIAALEGHHMRADHKVTTWIMFAGKVEDKSEGILARLTMERIPAGSCRGGMLVPDPLSCGYLLMRKSFSTGLQHAWLATRKVDSSTREYDWRWRIEIEEATRGTVFQNLLTVPMEGRSAEGALTCAMIAAGRGDELDRNTSMSACLQLKLQSTLPLGTVEGLDMKTLADRLRVKKISNVIVAKLHKDIETDTGSKEGFLTAATITDALDHFCIWPRISKAVRASIHEETVRERAALCGRLIPQDRQTEDGTDFVQPPIGIRHPQRDGDQHKLRAEPEPLSDDQLQQFVLCRWRPPQVAEDAAVRLQLFADSGMGKTVQLLICEQAIACDDTLRIPIRIGKRASVNEREVRQAREERGLDYIQWAGLLNANLNQVAQLLQRHVPEQHKEKTEDWVRRMAKLGQFVFLLDALDQQRHELTYLATFLSQEEICQCPALVAGRPESLTSRGEVFQSQNWERLELLKLQKSHQEKYLGTTLSEQLIPRSSTLSIFDPAEERRRHQWKDLLETPLLLSLMKQLATSQANGQSRLGDIRNRFELYQQASHQLFRKGLKSLDPPQRDAAEADVEELLQDIASHMVCRHNFDVLEGEEFDEWKKKSTLHSDKLRELVQVDLVKEYAFLDRMELEDLNDRQQTIRRGIEWRHRSFLEYYAARKLAKQWTTDSDNVKQTLKDVHECLDTQGDFRTWPAVDPATGEKMTAFRNLPGDWQWTLRFLLACATEPERGQIALELLRLGNPWIVVQALQQDHIELRDSNVENVCRWLVHRNRTIEVDYCGALKKSANVDDDQQAEATPAELSLEKAKNAYVALQPSHDRWPQHLLNPATRDAGLLSSLRTLRPTISRQTLQLWKTPTAARKQALDEYLADDRWVKVQGGTFDLSGYEDHNSIQPQQQPIGSFALSDFPVTNAVFEAFCASHRRWRNQYSDEDDAPALHVNWFRATEFCLWLSELTGDSYRLPTEWEWEWACRWENTRRDAYWWGPRMNDALCWYEGDSGYGPAKTLRRTRSRQEAISVFASADIPARHPSWESATTPGLLDMLGNVWEWCANPYLQDADQDDPESARVLRGGSWGDGAGGCCSAGRNVNKPPWSDYVSGFRVCRV